MIEAARFWAIVVLVVAGLFFTFVSAVGVIRLPDIYARAHTASQTDTLGAGLALAAVALALGWQQASVYTVLLLFFVFITNPTAAHAIARSAAETGIEPVTADSATDDGSPDSGTGAPDRNSSEPDAGSDVDGGETA
ncbi:monovalent cation/H(+) antiporter subunit G [Natrarchaeobius oligotrophus]|uniref:Na+/H+ antiporter subunit G n=1 Tax=Natrarchaeobius chitinivorans TaxID=1679083 RepID=A0A3N6NLP0_NATCH|nr:monovalent cation/H(+) antiporter subunit G [Natrarchaeobius chitinivorans]RQH00263.1 Na+/H+ antiporter subunit G [Natrarchaeobius chitinivorans]